MFSLSRAHDMLVTSFLISSPSLKFTVILFLPICNLFSQLTSRQSNGSRSLIVLSPFIQRHRGWTVYGLQLLNETEYDVKNYADRGECSAEVDSSV